MGHLSEAHTTAKAQGNHGGCTFLKKKGMKLRRICFRGLLGKSWKQGVGNGSDQGILHTHKEFSNNKWLFLCGFYYCCLLSPQEYLAH